VSGEATWPGLDVLFDPAHPKHLEGMALALAQADLALAEDEVPIGAVVVEPTRGIIGQGYNQREHHHDPTLHAEMIAIRHAAQLLRSWRLDDCCLYVTLEPCPMCAGAIIQARIPLLVYGADDPKAGACESLYRITDDARLNHRTHVVRGIQREACAAILSEFFKEKRRLGKK
jgi:tRNA(adenine34) deaminase